MTTPSGCVCVFVEGGVDLFGICTADCIFCADSASVKD